MRRLQFIFITLFVILVFILQKSYTKVVSSVHATTEESVLIQKDTIINEMSLRNDSISTDNDLEVTDQKRKKKNRKSASFSKNDGKDEKGKVAQKIRSWESDIRN